MELLADTWYQFNHLFDRPSVQLRDGSTMLSGTSQFSGSTLQAVTGMVMTNRYRQPVEAPGSLSRYLQLTLLDADSSDVDGPMQLPALSSRLLREQVLYLAESTYAYDVLISNSELTYSSRGAVCVCLRLQDDRADMSLLSKEREVQTAYQRGLLDEVGRSKAKFRLNIKPMMRNLTALRDSGYLPENAWQVDVVFGYWEAEGADESKSSPFGSGDSSVLLDELQVQFKQQTRPRGLKVSDLLSQSRR
jgi:hypothetical protein|tara:strand:- start:5592 stop:6335 length:744 start_codon:yes stop_codon:yes gene_type:complete